jgi:hypothetical protein
VLRRIHGHKTDEVTGRWWKLHNKGLENQYSQNIIKSDRVNENEREGTHITQEENTKHVQKACMENVKQRHQLVELGVDGKTILTFILNKQCVRMWNG